jgi:iron complex outermembrane receptor protein
MARAFAAALRSAPAMLAAAPVVLLPGLAAAQQAQTTTLPEVKVTGQQEVPNEKLPLDVPASTGSRLNISNRENPASVTVIERDTIEARGARDTQEILRGAPGLVASSPPGSAGFVSMRGFTGSQVTQMFNGISVQYDVIAGYPVDSWIYDRVEVLGGASSFLHGSGAVGGAVNYISKLATRQPLRQDVLARYGSFNTTQFAYGINGAVNESNALRLDISKQDSDGWVERSPSRSGVAAASWLVDITPNLSHTLAGEWQHKSQRPYWGTPLLNPVTSGQIDQNTRFKNYNSDNGQYAQDIRWLRSITDYRLSEKSKFTNTAYWYDAERWYQDVEVYTFNANNTLVNRPRSGVLATKHGQTLYGNKLEFTHDGALAGLPSQWAAGVDLSRNQQTRYPTSLAAPPTNIDSVNPYSPNGGDFYSIPGITTPTNPDRTNRVYTTSVYAENRTKLTGALSLVAGLRFDDIRLDVTNYRAVSATNPAWFKRAFNAWTGRAGLVYDLGKTANVYVNYSTSADPPAGILTTLNFASVLDFGLTTGRQAEAGAKFDFLEGRGNATVAVYRVERENLAITDPANPNNTLPVGAQSTRGIELAAGVRLSPQWRVQGNLSVLAARFDNFTQTVGSTVVSRAGFVPTNVPSRVANLWVTYAFAPQWEAGLALRGVSSAWGNVDNTVRAAGYGLVDASLTYRINKNHSITARGRNLGDRIYAENVTSTPMFYLGAPRSFELAYRGTF